MASRYEALLTTALTISAVALASAFVHREFFRGSAPAATLEAQSPTYVRNWRELESHGLLVGKATAPVHMIVFADFECPFCRTSDVYYRALRKDVGDSIALVYLHFPISGHRFAVPAAKAAECAVRSGRFSQMHDLLFDKQDSLGLKTWASFANDAGIQDTVAFSSCMGVAGIPSGITQGRAIGEKMQVHGTPTVIVNGWKFPGPPSEIELRQTFREIIERKTPSVALNRKIDSIAALF